MSHDHRREPHFGQPSSKVDEIQVPARPFQPLSKAAARILPWWAVLGGCTAFVIAVLIGWPMVTEGAAGPCVALEIRAMRLNAADNPSSHREAMGAFYRTMVDDMTDNMIREMATGYFATTAMRASWPNVPVALSCGATYWRSLAKPETLDFAQIAAKVRTPR